MKQTLNRSATPGASATRSVTACRKRAKPPESCARETTWLRLLRTSQVGSRVFVAY